MWPGGQVQGDQHASAESENVSVQQSSQIPSCCFMWVWAYDETVGLWIEDGYDSGLDVWVAHMYMLGRFCRVRYTDTLLYRLLYT